MYNLKIEQMKNLAILFLLASFMVAVSVPVYSSSQDKPKQEQKDVKKCDKKDEKACAKDSTKACCKNKKQACTNADKPEKK
jgi:hypothetical protein